MALFPDTGSPYFVFSSVADNAFGQNAHAGNQDDGSFTLAIDDQFGAKGGNDKGKGGGKPKDPEPDPEADPEADPEPDPNPVQFDPYTSGDDTVDDNLEYNITVEFNGDGWTQELVDVFIAAADFLSGVIAEDRPDYIAGDDPNNFFSTDIDDIQIKATMTNIDGPGGILAGAGPTHIIWDPSAGDTSADALPFAGEMEFDSSDVGTYLASGQLYDIVLHEMMHVLGFGTLWEYSGIVETEIDDMGTRRPVDDVIVYNYLGAYATAENGGVAPAVESDGGPGTAGGHWDEVTFNDELMTGYINDLNFYTSLSIGALVDLGYEVTDGLLLA
ncbi:MAG: leishmanolysin-related zinc metalloendopeptidase [Alphaproteobacteria bacterium]|nr:leishmanolysin-related zinc metalloendopeptidase [Alphaproteobacteria bacterium]